MKKIAVLLLILLNTSVHSFAQREQDSLALVALYNSTGGPNWINKTNWLSSEPISNWFGVTVENNRVNAINLEINNLKGTLPPEINKMTFLKDLRLGWNNLSGNIPIELWQLSNLNLLELCANSFSGNLSPLIKNLENLQFLYLHTNNLSGILPIELFSLIKLRDLQLHWNNFSGAIPIEINNLVNLTQFIALNNNKFTDLPPITLSSYYGFTVYSNHLTFEDLEPNISRISNYSPQDSIGLKQKLLRNIGENFTFTVTCGGANNLYQWKKNNVDIPSATNSTYTIPSLNYSDAGSYSCAVTNTVVLGLTINSRPVNLTIVDNGREQDSLALVALYNATGGPNWTNNTNWLSSQPISSWYGVTVESNRVIRLQLFYNNLIGTFPPQICNLSKLRDLFLSKNKLAGDLPPEIGNLTELIALNLAYNQITNIPSQLCSLSNLQSLNLFENQITGPIPTEICNLTNLILISLGINKITGTIPSGIGNLKNLISLDLTSNQITGFIPSSIGNFLYLEYFDLGGNNLSGIIPTEIINLKNLSTLILNFNQLSGSIPLGIGNLTKLKQLRLNSNKLTGILPSEIGNLKILEVLLLGSNQFNGIIPQEIGNLTYLTFLQLGDNQLTGSIPSEIGKLTNLTLLELAGNQLTGSIPSEIGNLINLNYFYLQNNKLTGTLPSEIGNLSNLAFLYISDNLLNGSIPNEINNLTQLRQLFLHNNKLDYLPKLTINSIIDLNIFRNRFTFEDIEPNISAARTLIYSPQDSIGIKQNVRQRIGKDYTFSVTCGGEHNKYQWVKNGSIIPSATASKYKISKLKQSDAGSYVCNVTNTVVTGLTISSRPINLTVTVNGRAKDSLALVTIYNTTGGVNWTNNTNWLSSEPISSWYGVTVGGNTGAKGDLYDTTSVVSINLSGNNLTGQIPSAIGDMVALQTLKLNNNDLTGSVPIEMNNITSLQTLELSKNNLADLPPLTLTLLDTLMIDNNQFSFEDIVPNLSVAAKGFTYYSQDSIGIKKDTTCVVGSNMKFVATDSAENNIYEWYKDGTSIPQATDKTYLRSNLAQSDGGSFTCTITNSSAPGLTLYQRPVKLQVSTPTSIGKDKDPGIKIYPNPSGGLVYIESSTGLTAGSRIEVSDISGRVVLQKKWEDNNRQELNLSHLPKGIYIVKVQSRTNYLMHKLVLR